MQKCKVVALVLIAVTFNLSCSKSGDAREPQAYNLPVPGNFPQPNYTTGNPMTKEGIALGRKLFYDKRLSGNNQLSCASCHHQELAFSDGVALSHIGITGSLLKRHSPALINMAWTNNGLFWDGGSTNLESQAFGPLTNADEMGQDLCELVDELKADPDYEKQFRFLFKDDIKAAYVVKALAQFQRTFVSTNSGYDRYRRKEAAGLLDPNEIQGMNLVKQKCQGCHKSDLFTDNGYHNNGLDNDFTNTAFEEIFLGRIRVSYDPADLGAFKTPTLRNIMLTAPYMHDGRFATIGQVLDHYSSQVKISPTLDPLLMQNPGATAGIPMTKNEKNYIIAFLNTLTDSSFITNKQISNPK